MVQHTSHKAPALGWPLAPVAHRGLHDAGKGCIENTASAFAAAIDKGYAIECDLQAARGGYPVVFHDEDLDRLMDVGGLVAGRTPEELTSLHYKATSDRILTLDEVLELVSGRVPLYVEIKTLFGEPGIFHSRIAERFKTYKGPLAAMSFDPKSVMAMRELAPAIPRGLISYRWDDEWMPDLPRIEKQKLAALAYAPDIDPSFIAYDIDDLPEAAPLALREQTGVKLFSWTVRTPEQRERARLYADAIIFEGFEA